MAKQLNASLAFINIPSDQPEQSAQFYQALFGTELVPALSDQESYHATISDDGIDLNVTARHSSQEATTPFLGVKNLDQAISTAQSNGGRVVWGPEDVTIPDDDIEEYRQAVREVDGVEVRTNKLGRAAIVADPGGGQVGLVQLEEHAHRHFNVGRHYRPLGDYRERIMARSRQAAERRGRVRGRRG